MAPPLGACSVLLKATPLSRKFGVTVLPSAASGRMVRVKSSPAFQMPQPLAVTPVRQALPSSAEPSGRVAAISSVAGRLTKVSLPLITSPASPFAELPW
ncbi:hypothetical protein D3C78_1056250 [compost metagenome]